MFQMFTPRSIINDFLSRSQSHNVHAHPQTDIQTDIVLLSLWVPNNWFLYNAGCLSGTSTLYVWYIRTSLGMTQCIESQWRSKHWTFYTCSNVVPSSRTRCMVSKWWSGTGIVPHRPAGFQWKYHGQLGKVWEGMAKTCVAVYIGQDKVQSYTTKLGWTRRSGQVGSIRLCRGDQVW